ncbi:PfkB family carbohydrate kinase [Streptomyces zingiberis]|uniref:PfkB family carbohydrate kinase n=1 Tax=Streptomyces zingiberis TaxID=2053010 RepID=UPI002892C673|nr:PfkB family carbohydrate kinase [Streptomyces zingiberis]
MIRHRDHAATAVTAGGRWRPEPFPLTAVDPAGAGDAFAAGCLSARLRELPEPDALAEAACVAALTVQCTTDTGRLPSATVRGRALAGCTAGREAAVHR